MSYEQYLEQLSDLLAMYMAGYLTLTQWISIRLKLADLYARRPR